MTAWTQSKDKPHIWERCDGFTVAGTRDGGWTAARPNGLMLRDGTAQNDIRYFIDRDAASRFVDRHHRIRDEH